MCGGFQDVEVPGFLESAYKCGKVFSLTLRPSLLAENIPSTHFCLKLSLPRVQRAARRIKSKKSIKHDIGNRTHDLPGCSAKPVPTSRLLTTCYL